MHPPAIPRPPDAKDPPPRKAKPADVAAAPVSPIRPPIDPAKKGAVKSKIAAPMPTNGIVQLNPESVLAIFFAQSLKYLED